MDRKLKFVKRNKKIRGIKKEFSTPVKCNLNKGDTVMLMVGDERKKTGVILKLKKFEGKVKALVSGLNEKKHFTKQNGILKKEAYIDISKIRFVFKDKPCRITKKAGGIRETSSGEIIPVSEFKVRGKK